MIRIGILGFGFMGNMHFNNYRKIDGVEIAAICDIDKDEFSGKSSSGNITGSESDLDLSGIALYTDAEEMFTEQSLDIVSITLPTYLHEEYAVKALHAGINVLCEKPMALDSMQCKRMIEASKESGKLLQIGHCIRFWPEYAEVKRIVESGQYGNVKAASFRRLSLTPGWAWDNWILDEKRSGGAIHDLHIHDADYIQYLLGMPKAVFSSSAEGASGSFDHTVAQYVYEDDIAVTAEGGWMMSHSFGFEMSFNIVLDEAVVCFDITRAESFRVCPQNSEAYSPVVDKADGYYLELEYFVKKVRGEDLPQILTPVESMDSVRIVEAERLSSQNKQLVEIN